MAILSLEEVPYCLFKEGLIAGLDLGTKTIGIALSDRKHLFAHPKPVLIRKKFTHDAQILLEFFNKEQVSLVVVGFPLNMNGTSGPRAQATRAFLQNMEKLTSLPFALWDERLSTIAARRSFIEMDISRKKQKKRIDSAAAAFILQGALDRLQNLHGTVERL